MMKIRKNMHEGRPRKQAIAIAFSQARKKYPHSKPLQKSRFDVMREEKEKGFVM